MAGDYHIEDIYQGGYSSLDPDSGIYFTGYRIPPGKIGLATDPRTANILNEVATKLRTGAKQIEVSTVDVGAFESIPGPHLKEIKRLSELTGVDISVHGPIIEPSGLSQQGYNEYARAEAERQMLSAVEKSHTMAPNGNVPVTFHSSTWQGTEYAKTENGVEKVRIPVINQDTGQANTVVQEMKRLYPGMTEKQLESGGELKTAEERIKILNETQWIDGLDQMIAIKHRADTMLSESAPVVYPLLQKVQEGKINPQYLNPDQKSLFSKFTNAGYEITDIYSHLSDMFEKAYKFGSDREREKLVELSKGFPNTNEIRKIVGSQDYIHLSDLMQNLMENLREFSPQVIKPLDEFASDKTATTFANVAFDSFKKFKDKAPIISIENPPAGLGISRAEELDNLVQSARRKFIDRAVKEGMGEKDAKAQADKLIGVTWDVGHINMLRKYGFTEEDVVKESAKVAPLVKHVHLSDNFGFEHTELPMGMGNVPIKEIMEKLGEKGFDARKVIEAGNWWQHFKTPPFQETLQAFGSPIYGIKMQPYWNQAVGTVGYFSGYGQMLPQVNYETMGSGFSMLPQELGGQRQTGRSRMSGNPLE